MIRAARARQHLLSCGHLKLACGILYQTATSAPMPKKTPNTTIGMAPVPPRANLEILRDAAAGCRACDLWKRGTQTVFGEGARTARVMFVGEQPGDKEDVMGRPFV